MTTNTGPGPEEILAKNLGYDSVEFDNSDLQLELTLSPNLDIVINSMTEYASLREREAAIGFRWFCIDYPSSILQGEKEKWVEWSKMTDSEKYDLYLTTLNNK